MRGPGHAIVSRSSTELTALTSAAVPHDEHLIGGVEIATSDVADHDGDRDPASDGHHCVLSDPG